MAADLAERNLCPEEFQARIREAGGLNRYDEANFKIVWGQTETFRAGGVWEAPGESAFTGYRDLLLGMGERCWLLLQWQPPEKYGTPESYYVRNYDPETNLQTLGEYPYSGRYEIVQSFVWKGLVNGKLVVEHMPLSSLLIDLVVPIMREAQAVSMLRIRELARERREKQQLEQVNAIEDSIRNATPEWISRSAARLSCNSSVQKKAEQIEQHWKRAVTILRERGKGLSVGSVN